MNTLKKLFGLATSNYKGEGSYRTNYRNEECMKFTDKDQAVLDNRGW